LPAELTQKLIVAPFKLVVNLVAEVSGNSYWRSPFHAICAQKSLVEFTVMDIEPIRVKPPKSGVGALSTKVRDSFIH